MQIKKVVSNVRFAVMYLNRACALLEHANPSNIPPGHPTLVTAEAKASVKQEGEKMAKQALLMTIRHCAEALKEMGGEGEDEPRSW